MAKQEPQDFAEENDALIILPEEKGAHDALVLLPEADETDDTLVLLPEEAPDTSVRPQAEAKLPDEKRMRHDITQRTVKTGWKKRAGLPKLGIETLTGLPANIAMVRGFMKAINWKEAQEEVLAGLSNTVVIVGQPNTGKSTLFNHLKGQHISEVSPQAGTTKTLIRTDFGPFTLVDTPGHLPDVTETGIEQASLVVFMVDGEKGLRPDDRNLLMTIKKLEKPTLVVVNKIDTLKNSQAADTMANDVAMRLGIPGVIPISARAGTNVAEELVPAMIAASPEAALVIGRELPAYRREAAQRIIRNATLVSLAAGLEPIPLIDIPILIGTQVRLVLRLAALYGEPIDSADAVKHARELVMTMISGLGLRFLAEQAAKAVPFGGDVVAGAIAGAATWSIGEVALEYYEGGKSFNAARLRALTNGFYRRFRKGLNIRELSRQADKPLAIEPPETNHTK
ncbi:MAG TPA: GTPase [Ktedonobacteraceae bacterium]|nr:GTPase [Ktedonobacteraceae bacterium]